MKKQITQLVLIIFSIFCLIGCTKKEDDNEIVEKKTTNSTIYKSSNGKIKEEIYTSNIRFYDENGELTDYDPSLVEVNDNENLDGYAYENKTGDMKTYFPTNLETTTPILLKKDSNEIKITPTSEETLKTVEKNEKEDTLVKYKNNFISYEYESQTDGIKENVILNKAPQSNILTYEISVDKNTIIEKNNENCILFKNSKNEEIATISKAFMFDSSDEENYNDNIRYEIEKKTDTIYELKMILDQDFLNNSSIAYPITVDPSVSWTGNSQITDSYIFNGSKYADINFYDSGTTAFAIGYSKTYGVARSLLKINGLKDTVKNKYVANATLSFYETESSDANNTIYAYRIIDDWKNSTVTWNNKPRYNYSDGSLGSCKTSGKVYTKQMMNITDYVQKLANGTYTNDYGIMLKSSSSGESSRTGKYSLFIGSRHANSKYKPKLTIEYYERPTNPTSISLSKSYLKLNESATLSWEGITSQSLDHVEYRVAKRNDETGVVDSIANSIIPYTQISTKGSSSEVISTLKTLPEGCYRLIVRGVDTSGVVGSGKGIDFHIDKTVPTIQKVSLSTENSKPIISWTNASDLHFKELQYSINNGTYKTMSTETTGSFEVPNNELSGTGTDKISIIAVDKSGNKSQVYDFTYTYSVTNNLDEYIPSEISVNNYYGKTLISWTVSSETSILPGDISYNVYRGTSENVSLTQNNLVASNLKQLYFIDKNTAKAYYKIQVVKGSAKKESNTINNYSLKQNTLDTQIGEKEYLSYAEFSTPNGNGMIEKSSGNLTYSQTDFNLASTPFSLSLLRTYNSKSDTIGMFGRGWNDSFHSELYQKNDKYYFEQTDGSIYTFEKDGLIYGCVEDDTYELSIKQHSDSIELGSNTYAVDSLYQISTKENTIYKFNEFGQLVLIEDTNENYIYYQYNNAGLLETITNSNQLSIKITYKNNLVNKITLPNKSIIVYAYDSYDNLIQVRHADKNNENEVSYIFDYTDDQLSDIIDAENNYYSITYQNKKVSQLIYPNNDTLQFQYGSDSTIETKKNGSNEIYSKVVFFDTETGKTLKEIDENGYQTTYVYDSENPFMIHSVTKTVEYETIENGKIKKNFKTVETVTNYNDNNDINEEIETITDTNATTTEKNITTYTYGLTSEKTENLPTEIKTINVKGLDTTTTESYNMEYDSNGNLTKEINHIDKIINEKEYSKNGLVTKETSISENNEDNTSVIDSIVEYKYDEYGNMIGRIEKSGDQYGYYVNEYNNMGSLEKTIKLATDNVTVEESTTYTLDYLERIVHMKNEKHLDDTIITDESTYVYNKNGAKTKESSNGRELTYTYNDMNQVVKTSEKNESGTSVMSTIFEYATLTDYYKWTTKKNLSNILCEKTYKNNSTQPYKITYTDASENILREESNGLIVDNTYDNQNNLIAEIKYGTNTEKQITLNLFDENQHNTYTIINPELKNNEFIITDNTIIDQLEFDELGNVSKNIDANKNETNYIYNSDIQLKSIKYANNTTLNFEYTTTNNNNITKTIYQNNKVSTEIKNEAGQTILNSDSDGTNEIKTEYIYDQNGKKIKELYSNGSYQTFTYINNLLVKTIRYNSDDEKQTESEYSYDQYGNNNKIIDYKFIDDERIEYNKISMTYDTNNRLITYKINDSSTTIYIYNAENQITRIVYPQEVINSNGIKALEYKYNDYEQLLSITAELVSGRKVVIKEYKYDVFGNTIEEISNSTNYDGTTFVLTKTSTYDIFNRLVEFKYSNNLNSNIEQHSYTYDKNSNILSEIIQSNNTMTSKVYTYDCMNQLIKSEITTNNQTRVNTYTYDEYGNIIEKNEDGLHTLNSYNVLGQLITSRDYKNNICISSKTYTYDENGNNISIFNNETKETITMEYDATNQLIKYIDNDTVVQENVYDSNGKRIQKKEGNNVINYNYYNDLLLSTTDENGNVTAQNIVNVDNDILSTVRFANNTMNYYVYEKDYKNSVLQVVNMNGNNEVSYNYTDFGETTISGNTDFYNEICYTSGIFDKTTDLYYLNARYYNPSDARFITMDTYRGETERLNSLNLYAYCEGNPITNFDPSGHYSTKPGAKTVTIKYRLGHRNAVFNFRYFWHFKWTEHGPKEQRPYITFYYNFSNSNPKYNNRRFGAAVARSKIIYLASDMYREMKNKSSGHLYRRTSAGLKNELIFHYGAYKGLDIVGLKNSSAYKSANPADLGGLDNDWNAKFFEPITMPYWVLHGIDEVVRYAKKHF